MENPEQWRQYDECYWVSDLGRVKRVYKNGRVYYLHAFPRCSCRGDRVVRVRIHSKAFVLNKLVWQVFRGDIPDGYTVVNKNGYYTMNDLYSLRLVKISDCKKRSAISRGRKVIDLHTGIVYPSCRYLARKMGISHMTIINFCNHDRPSKKDYHVEYYDENKSYSGLKIRFIRSKLYD
jgi:hypothetical protein